MRLVPNAKSIALTSHSMWAVYLGTLTIFMPELLWFAFDKQTSPYGWGYLAVAIYIYGGLGRLFRQGIDHGTSVRRVSLFFPVAVAIVFVILLSACKPDTVAMTEPDPIPAPVVEQASPDPFSAMAVEHIGRWEGLRLAAYKDIVGVWTVCYGETKGVQSGDAYSKAECDAMLARQVQHYRERLHRHFTADTIVLRLPVPRDVAFTSLAYNAGVGAIGKSTAVKRLNADDVQGACDALTWWNKAGGRLIRGLVNRRTSEQALCLQGVA